MADDLHRLVYYSRNMMPGSEDEVLAGIEQILATSRVNNEKVGVTGALLFNSGCFAQVLEGTRSAISETFERIQCDPRHGDVLVLEFAPAAKRSFSTWSMGFVGHAQRDQSMFGSISERTGFDPQQLDAEQIFATMHRLMLEEESPALV